jgi:hypothetical protein
MAAPLLAFALNAPVRAADAAPTTCKDGTTSTSTGKGTCSGHGGVQKATAAAPAPAAAPAAETAPAATAAKSATATRSAPTTTAGNTDPTGATAKCKDGTYSKSQHRSGTCSSHGGVDTWLTAQ